MIDFPTGQYNVIYSDPPWTYRDKCRSGQRGAGYKFDLMSLDEIKALPVTSLAAPDCTLFLWAVPPMLHEAFTVLEAWGFKYKTVAFTWIKTTVNGKIAMGMGHWTRANAEMCLLATRGHPHRVCAGVSSVIISKRRDHSCKPDEARERIEELMGDVPRIELFARGEAPEGWTFWGKEVED